LSVVNNRSKKPVLGVKESLVAEGFASAVGEKRGRETFRRTGIAQ